MTEVLARGSRIQALHVRPPAYAAMSECLRIQSTARKPSWLARLLGQNPIEPDARSWYRGALGELQVARTLAALPDTWTVLHHSPAALEDASPIDHVVIGPAGVFTIATKNHAGQRVWVDDERILVNGHRTNHIADARHEAAHLSRVLGAGDDGPVTPILTIVDPATLIVDRKRSSRVLVIPAHRLARTLLRLPRTASDAAVAALVLRAELGGTWTATTSRLDDSLRHEARFLRLKAEVDAAWQRRVAWVVAVSATAVLMVLWSAAGTFTG